MLLFALTFLVAFGSALASVPHGELWVAVSFTWLMLSCAVAVSASPVTRRRLIAFALVVIAADVTLVLDPVQPLIVAVGSLRTAFLAFVTIAILTHVVRADRVTHDTILGGICVYLLIGLFFQSAFGIVEVLHPGSFQTGGVAVSDLPGADRAHGRYPTLIYYSFVTLTTVGFGDITPTWSLAQSLSTIEAVVGQLYLAILVASLVGTRLAGQGPGQGSS
jgi:hypothetical protein